MSVRVINADVLDGLAGLPDDSVHCVVTSPPYFGLRDYGVQGQIGLEPTPAAFVGKLVDVFREVRRVLCPDGTCWLNMGDSYCSTDKWGGGGTGNSGKQTIAADGTVPSWAVRAKKPHYEGIKPKDLMLIPERLAIALQEDGWYIRARIIWSKPNPMPESVTDRPTKSHEHIWLMSKQPRYYYDQNAIREDHTDESLARVERGRSDHHKWASGGPGNQTLAKDITKACHPEGRNARDVWTIATSPFAEAHFATFPPELAERCIKAGCPAGGTVLDPFGGSGTTGLVADRLQRNAILIELNPAYADMARRRVTNDCPLFAEAAE